MVNRLDEFATCSLPCVPTSYIKGKSARHRLRVIGQTVPVLTSMLSRTLCLTITVLLLGTALCSHGAKFAVATFNDTSCGTLSSFPDVPTAGQCTFSSAFQTFYNVSARSDTLATYNFGCTSDCSSCVKSGSVPFGSCVSSPPLSALILPVQRFVTSSLCLELTSFFSLTTAPRSRSLSIKTAAVQLCLFQHKALKVEYAQQNRRLPQYSSLFSPKGKFSRMASVATLTALNAITTASHR